MAEHDRQTLEDAFASDPEARGHLGFFAQLPDSAVDAGLCYWWDPVKLFRVAASLPVEDVSVREFAWVFDVR